MLKKIVNKISKKRAAIQKKKNEKQFFRGIDSGRQAFTGPKILELDVSGKCINKCIACWVHSPKVKKTKNPGFLDYKTFKSQLKEFKKLNIKKIQISGAGEPLLHPDIKKILNDLKKEGHEINLITSLYPIPIDFAEFLVLKKIENITVSLWAGSYETWCKMHPGINESSFNDINIFFREIQRLKLINKTELPRIKIYNVITSLNYDSINEMTDFAVNSFADEIEFQSVDIIKGATDFLKLNSEQTKSVLNQFHELRHRNDYTGQFIGDGNRLNLDTFENVNEQREFGRFYHPLKKAFAISPSGEITCPYGFKTIKSSWVHDHPFPEIAYEWNNDKCRSCDLGHVCYPHPKDVPLKTKFLNLTGAGSFLRRIYSQGSNSPPDCRIIDDTPCTVGWHYLRILSNGDVIPCCKASKFPLGSINNKSLSSIWYSENYNDFRKNAFLQNKTSPYFKKINCLNGCDNLGMNLKIAKAIQKRKKLNIWNTSCLNIK